MKSFFSIFLALFFLCSFSATETRADSINITGQASGTIVTGLLPNSDGDRGTLVDLSGPGFEVTVRSFRDVLDRPDCQPGETCFIQLVTNPDEDNFGFDVRIGDLECSGRDAEERPCGAFFYLDVEAKQFLVPVTDAPFFTVTTPIGERSNVDAMVRVGDDNNYASFDIRGTATAFFRRSNGGGLILETVSYDIRPASEPIPEPATMLLFGTGLAGFGAAFRKRRAAHRNEEE